MMFLLFNFIGIKFIILNYGGHMKMTGICDNQVLRNLDVIHIV